MRTSVNPLITNFIVPQKPEVVSENEIQMIYDPQKQITLFMGGGRRSSTRSNDGYKRTDTRTNGGLLTENDAERWTDD